MPHSTFLSTHPSIHESKPLSSQTTTTIFPGSPPKHFQSPSKSVLKPSLPLAASSLPRKRFFLTHTAGGPPSPAHGRSKSLNSPPSTSQQFTMSLPPTSCPSPSRPSASYSPPRRMVRELTPPLIRASSLPLVIPEGQRAQPSFTTTPPTPTTPQRSHYATPSSPRRTASPTRIYASSLTTSSPRTYHSSSSFRAPSPPNYLVNEPSPTSTPSTPTSLRSRSPSISSLETIPDSPDAEAEAVEVAAKDAAVAKEKDSTRRRSLDFDRVSGASGRWGSPADKRKRWSICGGEKRGDLDLETIWEEAVAAGRGEREDDLDSVDE